MALSIDTRLPAFEVVAKVYVPTVLMTSNACHCAMKLAADDNDPAHFDELEKLTFKSIRCSAGVLPDRSNVFSVNGQVMERL